MSSCVVWVDAVQAKIFKLSVTGVKRKVIHINANRQNSEFSFFNEVTREIGEPPEKLLIMGAGTTKNEFKKYLEKFHSNNLLESVVGIEPLAEVTDVQILEASRRYFKKHSTYNLSM